MRLLQTLYPRALKPLYVYVCAYAHATPAFSLYILDEIEKETGKLAENPPIFPISQDEYIAKRGIRYMFIKNYFIFYTIEENLKTVSIIRILYARRDWINLFRREP